MTETALATLAADAAVVTARAALRASDEPRKYTWAQRMDTGEQGLTSVSYDEPDDESLAWVASRA